MPQPFKGRYTINILHAPMAQRPQLAKHLGIIASLWSYVELHLGHLLADILHTEARIGAAMYAAIRAEAARLAAMQAAAEAYLDDALLEEFQELKDRIKKTGDQRDNVIHGIWGISKDRPDSIIWADARKDMKYFSMQNLELAKPTKKLTEKEIKEINDFVNARQEHFGSFLEYKEQDFINIENSIQERLNEIWRFRYKIISKSFPRQTPPRAETNPPPSKDGSKP